MTSQAWPYSGIGCDGGVGFSNATQVNDWLRGQGKSSSASTQPAGAYWDRLIDVASVFTNYSDANFRITSGGNQNHLNDGGNAYLAAMTNAGMGVQGSSIQALVSSTCGANNDIACLNEANTFFAWPTIKANGPGINLTNTGSGGGSSNWEIWGSNGMNFFQFNGQLTMAWWPISGGFNLTLQANQCYGWDDATGGAFLLADAPDTAMCRDGGDTFDFGNGSYQDRSATLRFAKFNPGILYSAAGTTLPSCASGIQGEQAVVSDATSPTYMGAYTSGGTITTAVICSYDGTTYTWKTH